MCIRDRPRIVGQAKTKIRVLVPPRQVRGIDENVYFSSMPRSKRELIWDYEIVEITATKSE